MPSVFRSQAFFMARLPVPLRLPFPFSLINSSQCSSGSSQETDPVGESVHAVVRSACVHIDERAAHSARARPDVAWSLSQESRPLPSCPRCGGSLVNLIPSVGCRPRLIHLT